MSSKTRQLIDFAKKKFGLDNYYLKRHRFDREVTPANETVYTFSMELMKLLPDKQKRT